MGKPHIDDDDMMLHIFSNIPEDYDIIVDRVKRDLSNKTLTLDSLLEDLQEKFERMMSKKAATKKQLFIQSKSRQGAIYLCGKIGHKSEDCWELESNKNKRLKNWKSDEKNENGNKQYKNPNIVCWEYNKKDTFKPIVQKATNKNQG
jgi:hypothetical protein